MSLSSIEAAWSSPTGEPAVKYALIAIAEEMKRFNDRQEAKRNISGFVMNINERR